MIINLNNLIADQLENNAYFILRIDRIIQEKDEKKRITLLKELKSFINENKAYLFKIGSVTQSDFLRGV